MNNLEGAHGNMINERKKWSLKWTNESDNSSLQKALLSPPNYQCISGDLMVIWFIQKKSNSWRYSPQEPAGRHLHRLYNQGATWWLMFCLQNTQMTSQVLLLINTETFIEHFVWTGFLNVSVYGDSPINEEGYKPCSLR